jgi:hypothetical protein
MFWSCWGLVFWFGLFSSCYRLGKSASFPHAPMLRHVGLLGMSAGKYVKSHFFARINEMKGISIIIKRKVVF